MKKNTILGLAAAAMLAGAPTASAAYWTVHSEILQSIVENFIIKVLQNRDEDQNSSAEKTRGQPVTRPERGGSNQAPSRR